VPLELLPLYAAGVAGAVVIAGWIVTHILSVRKETNTLQRQRDRNPFEELISAYPPDAFTRMIIKSDIAKIRLFYGVWTAIDHKFIDRRIERALICVTKELEVELLVERTGNRGLSLSRLFGLKMLYLSRESMRDPVAQKKEWKKTRAGGISEDR
jgi:hypothetical protein